MTSSHKSDVHPDGTLAYESVGRRELVAFDRNGNRQGIVEFGAAADVAHPHVSPDGGRIVATLWDPVNQDIWVHDLDRSQNTRVTADVANDLTSVWAADGQRVFFASARLAARGRRG